jgi:release factor glutamine methyltransferase
LSIKHLLAGARQKLNRGPSARFDAEILMAHVLESSRSFLYANPEFELPSKRSEHFKRLVKQRAVGKPIAYLTGKSEFWSLPLKISPAVLIPRPETERLVELALEKIPPKANWRIADLGTGSGAIALALASERNNCEILATDISTEAIKVARENAHRLNFSQIQFLQGSWSNPLEGKFQMILSNPPYIDANDSHLGQGDLRFEPRQALTPGVDGLSAIRKISELSYPMLLSGGWLMFEHGYDQGPATRAILKDKQFTAIETNQDLAGHDRVTTCMRP